jgi:HAD superfamily hydrolase (TIGR01484 family)
MAENEAKTEIKEETPEIFVFDLDGTLAVSKQNVTPEIGDMLAALMSKARVAVMSGAGFAQFEKQFIPALPEGADYFRLYIFPTNAAQCYVYRDGVWRTNYSELFTEKEKDKIIKAIHNAIKDTGFGAPLELWGEQIEDRGAQITFSALGQKAPIEVKRIWDPTREKRRPLYEYLVKKLPECAVGLNATTSIDITKKGISKAYGVEKLAEITGVPISKMIYIGDALFEGGNDSIVIPTGIKTHQVANPDETKKFIESILPNLA